MAVDRNERVKIEHPDLPDTKDNPPTVTRGALEDVWRGRGWVLHKPKKKGND